MILIKPSYEILTEIDRKDILKRIEATGRTCYKSENKITEESSSRFVSNIIKNGHLSVIEHINLTIKFICDRGISHEIVRHRLVSYSQESTRYCSYEGDVAFIIPLWSYILPGKYKEFDDISSLKEYRKQLKEYSDCLWYDSMADAESTYHALLKNNWKPQQARSVLPNSLKTEIVCTCNLREWKHILKLRCSERAHPQIREIMIPLRNELRQKLPEIFEE